MKLFKASLFFTLVLAFSLQINAQCKPKQVVNGCKPNLGSFTYDTYVYNEITIDDKDKIVEAQFTAFGGEKYKIVFCSYNMGENMIALNIYDKNSKVKTRKKVYDNSNGIDNLFWSFEPKKSGTYYIEYSVPKSKDAKVTKACVVMMIGFLDDEEE